MQQVSSWKEHRLVFQLSEVPGEGAQEARSRERSPEYDETRFTERQDDRRKAEAEERLDNQGTQAELGELERQISAEEREEVGSLGLGWISSAEAVALQRRAEALADAMKAGGEVSTAPLRSDGAREIKQNALVESVAKSIVRGEDPQIVPSGPRWYVDGEPDPKKKGGKVLEKGAQVAERIAGQSGMALAIAS